MELKITKYLKEHGLDKTVEDFKLKVRDYPHKVLIKYDTIESNFVNEEVREARGLVLEKDTWECMSLAFKKFFNYGEGYAADVNWETSRIFKKLDGTLIHVYHDYVTGDICFGTTGTAEGEGEVDNFHYTHNMGGNFAELFAHAYCETLARQGLEVHAKKKIYVKAFLAKYAGYTLAFELCTPYNIVVTPHSQSEVYLLGARKLDTMEEVSFERLEEISKDLHIPLAPTMALNSNIEFIKDSFVDMPYREEGYVVCDYNKVPGQDLKRLKVKNPAYCTIHFFKDKTAFWRIIDIVRGGEDNVNEYIATFPGREDEVAHLNAKWKETHATMNEFVSILETFEDYKEYLDHKKSIVLGVDGFSPAALDLIYKKRWTHVRQTGMTPDKELIEGGFNHSDINILHKLRSDRGDEIATKLRNKAAAK